MNALSTDVIVYVRKKDTHMLAEKYAYYRAFGYKKEKTLYYCACEKKMKKKRGGAFLKENLFSMEV